MAPGLPRLKLVVYGQMLTARLIANPTTRDLLSLLPLPGLPARDFMHFEKIAYLPRKPRTEGAPASHTPAAGDLGYFAPWGNLALFHDGWQPSAGLVLLGRFEGLVAALRIQGETTVRAERLP